MATKFQKGDKVRVKSVVPQGPVQKLHMTEDGQFFYQISWKNENGVTCTRWFPEETLVSV